MKRFMLISRIFLAIIFLVAVYLIYNPQNLKQGGEQLESSIPRAVAGLADTRITLLRSGVAHLDGQNSFDPDGGEIMNYRWVVVDAPHLELLGKVVYDGPKPQAPHQQYGEQDIGAWIYELEVTDDEGFKHRDTKNVFVQRKVTSILEPLKKQIVEVKGIMDSDIVLGVEINGESMAYPAKTVFPYGVVNDLIGGEPVVVVFCEACQTGAVKKRTINNRILTFLTLGGTLEEENFLIKDQETGSIWHAAYGTAESGAYKDSSLEEMDFTLTSWGEWRRLYPDSLVLVSE